MIPTRFSAKASNVTPPSDDRRPPSKAAITFFGLMAGKEKRQQRIVGHGGCGRLRIVEELVLSNEFVRHIMTLSYIRQPFMHKVG